MVFSRGACGVEVHPECSLETHPIGTDLMSTCQAVYFNLRAGGSVNKVFEGMAFACLPVHV